jgi:hypothetical protein
MVSCTVTDIAGCDLESGHLVEERRRVAYTPSIHADSASGRNRLRPAKHFTVFTVSHARFHRRRHITHARTLTDRLTRAHAHARETRAHAVRVSVSHAREDIT